MSETKGVDHERIWLGPDCEGNASAGNGRTWCSHNVFDACPDCGATATEYVRADLIERLEARAEAAEAERDALAKALGLAANKFAFADGLADPLNKSMFLQGAKTFCENALSALIKEPAAAIREDDNG